MRYIADSSGYLQQVSFGANITCDSQECTLYSGTVPTGYSSLEDWYLQECEKLYRWKIVSGNLTMDSSAAAPVDSVQADYIVEQGYNGTWEYRIWASGMKECWISSEQPNMNFSNAQLQSGLYCLKFGLFFPFYFFSAAPFVVVDGGSRDCVNFLRVADVSDYMVYLSACSMDNTVTDTTVFYNIYAKGT